MTLKMVQTPDILNSVCSLSKRPFTVGFAAETENVLVFARQKRLNKGADLIAANDVSDKTIGFNSDKNAIVLIGKEFEKSFSSMPKTQLAKSFLLTCLDYQENKKNSINN